MQTVTTIGLDIAKSVFQVHGVDAAGQVLIRRQLKRRTVLVFFQKLPPCLVVRRGDVRADVAFAHRLDSSNHACRPLGPSRPMSQAGFTINTNAVAL